MGSLLYLQQLLSPQAGSTSSTRLDKGIIGHLKRKGALLPVAI
jgi:hypothetical protein